jgi:hypothetical protein
MRVALAHEQCLRTRLDVRQLAHAVGARQAHVGRALARSQQARLRIAPPDRHLA